MPGRPWFAIAAVLLAGCIGCSDAPRRPPNVVLIVLDTVRADRVRCAGDEGSPTPHLDALCERSVVFTHASSTSSWTLPAHASLFTGLYPLQHGVSQEYTRLDAGAGTLAEILGTNGYRTFGISANPIVSIKSGLARGFEEFAETWRVKRRGPPAPSEHPNFRAAARLVGGLPSDQPFFLFVNYIEAHGPNSPPEPHRSRALAPQSDPELVKRASKRSARGYYLQKSSISGDEFAVLNDLYDGEVAYLDALVGGLLAQLEASGRLEDTVVVVTSDHGENLGEHGHFRHVFSLYNSTVRVPLLIRLPGDRNGGTERHDPVGLVDVFATILALTGEAEIGKTSNGRDLFGESAQEDPPAIFAEYYYPNQVLTLFPPDATGAPVPVLAPYLRRLRSIEREGLRLIWSSDGRHELFDLNSDPEELRNLHDDPRYTEAATGLLDRLAAFVAAGGGPRPMPDGAQVPEEPIGVFEDLDAESADLLRKLGYLPP